MKKLIFLFILLPILSFAQSKEGSTICDTLTAYSGKVVYFVMVEDGKPTLVNAYNGAETVTYTGTDLVNFLRLVESNKQKGGDFIKLYLAALKNEERLVSAKFEKSKN
jgi:hypothetical protein